MTYGAFKEALRAITQGDSVLPADSALKPLIKSAIEEVAMISPPLKLVTSDYRDLNGESPVVALDSSLYVRAPITPQSDSDEIDIDEDLALAIAHFVAAKLARNNPMLNIRGWHRREGLSLVNSYVWRKWQSEQSPARSC
jgi:hypothetical protein